MEILMKFDVDETKILRCRVVKNNKSFRFSVDQEIAIEQGIDEGDTVFIALLRIKKATP